jgi:hypothetical protein
MATSVHPSNLFVGLATSAELAAWQTKKLETVKGRKQAA